MTFDQLNQMSQAVFTETLAGIFEHSPWVAAQTWWRRPFQSVAELHAAMCATLAAADPAAQMTLIRAHPELAGKAALRGELTQASSQEQSGAGLDQCSPEEFKHLTRLNKEYGRKFGFPFILAVRGHTRSSIIANMAARITNARDAEIAEALRQIERIAALRLAAVVTL